MFWKSLKMDKYVAEKILGEGTYSEVKRVRRSDGEILAQKSQLRLTLPEYQASNLSHPNLITMNNILPNIQGKIYTYLTPVGKSLYSYTNLSFEERLKYIGDIIDGLAHLHLNGILHLDLKPQNIIIADDKAVIIDFGTSMFARSELDVSFGYLITTSQYRNVNDDMNFDKYGKELYSYKSDLYSLGIIILGLLWNTKLKTYENKYTGDLSTTIPDIKMLMNFARIQQSDEWSDLVMNLLSGNITIQDVMKNELFKDKTFHAKKLFNPELPINLNSNMIEGVISEFLENAEFVPYYLFIHYIRLYAIYGEKPSLDIILDPYGINYDDRKVTPDSDIDQIIKYGNIKIELIEDIETCKLFHQLLKKGSYREALELKSNGEPVNKVTLFYEV